MDEIETKSSIGEIGERMLREKLTSELQNENRGRVVMVNTTDGSIAFGESPLATWRALGSPKGGTCYAARVGGGGVYHFGGRRRRIAK